MALMKEAMSKVDYDRKEKGLPPLKAVLPPRHEPAKPVVEKEITTEDITAGYNVELESAKKRPLRNADGVLFIGYDVVIYLIPPAEKKDEKKPLEPKILRGWMQEGQFLAMVRTYSKQIDRQVIHG